MVAHSDLRSGHDDELGEAIFQASLFHLRLPPGLQQIQVGHLYGDNDTLFNATAGVYGVEKIVTEGLTKPTKKNCWLLSASPVEFVWHSSSSPVCLASFEKVNNSYQHGLLARWPMIARGYCEAMRFGRLYLSPSHS